MANTIFIGPADQQPEVLERPASERILPGQFVVESNGAFQLLNGSTNGVVYIVLENLLDDTLDAYELGDSIQAAKIDGGQYYQSILEGGKSVLYGDPLVVNSGAVLTSALSGDNILCNADHNVSASSEVQEVRVFVSTPRVQFIENIANLNGSDQYWQLNEDIIIAENVDFVLEITLKANTGSYYIYGSDTINNDYRLAFVGDASPKAYGFRFNDITLSDPRDTNEHVLKVERVGTNIKIFVNGVEQASETVTAVALLINRLGGKFDGTTSVGNLDGYAKEFKRYENGQLIDHIKLTNKSKGGFQVAETTPLGENLYTPSDIENPSTKGNEWSYLGGGRWYLDGTGALDVLQFILSADQPNSGYIQFEIESLSGGTIGCTTASVNAATFDSVGVKTYYYEDLTTQGNSIQFKRREGTVQAVIKNIKHYDANGILVASMVGYDDDVWS